MTKTLNEIVETILEELSGFKINDDFPIPPDYIKSKVVGINGSLMREEYGRLGFLSEQYYQLYNCNQVECLGFTCTVGGIVIQKKLPIYKVSLDILQTGIGWADIRYFGLHTLRKNFLRTDIAGLSYSEFRTFTGKKTAYAKVGTDLFIINLPTSGTRLLSSVAILADPRNAVGWSDDTSIFPTPSNFKLEMLVKQDILRSMGASDLVDDGQRLASGAQPVRERAKNDD